MKIRTLLATLTILVSLTMQGKEAKYIFYFIGDGMGLPHVMGAQTYLRTVANDDDGLLMMRFPAAGQAMTFSASSPVTDSAAAGTALSTGHKTKNGMLGMNADTLVVFSIAQMLKDKGYGVGICTSVGMNDATPGAFYAHVPHRDMAKEIVADAAASNYDFIAGAGYKLKSKDTTPTAYFDSILISGGWDVVRGEKAFLNSKSDKIVLLSENPVNGNNVGMTIDSINGALTLPVITKSCLSHLNRVSPDRFFMMVEGGNIDHAGHANDAGGVIKEVLNFDSAIAIAYEFYKQHPDETLIVVTADHDTGGMALGNDSLHYDLQLQYLDYQKISKDYFSDMCKAMLKSKRVYTWNDMKELLKEKFGFWDRVPVKPTQEKQLIEKFDQTFNMRNAADEKTLYESFNAFAVEVFKVLDSVTGLGWTTHNHTGNLVPVYAIGVGAEKFGKVINNIDIPKAIFEITKE